MNRYGQRYLTSSFFVSYCSGLNVKLSEKELGLYEREGVLYPVAYIVLSEEYLAKRKETDQNPGTYGEKLLEWEEIERALYGYSPTMLGSDFDLWHHIDRELEAGNKYLQKLNIDGPKQPPQGNIKKYYHYYQVHQVYEIQRKYPVFAKYHWVFENLRDDTKNNASNLLPKEDGVAFLYGQAPFFNALSFYIELASSEREKTFKPIPEINGVKALNDQQFEKYISRIKSHASFVFQKFGLTDDNFYQFLLYLLDLHSQYEGDERMKLANELTADIRYSIDFFANARGVSESDIEEKVKIQDPTKTKKFRHIDSALEVYDCAKETFEYLASAYNDKFPESAISSADIVELLDFIEKSGLFIVPHAIFDIDKVLNTERAFKNTSLYIGLTNLSIGLECFLRELANKTNEDGGTKIRVDTLYQIIKEMFLWGNRFAKEHQDRKQKYGNNVFLYLEDVYSSKDIDEIVRISLIAHESRNFVAHNYTLDQYFYNNWYGKIYTAICEIFFYSWVYFVFKK